MTDIHHPRRPAEPDRAGDPARDLGHLHPDRVGIGGVGVFAGDWASVTGADGSPRIPVGFVGTLVDRWNGWAVFRCSRAVAEAIVADQHRCRQDERQRLAADGMPEADLDAEVDRRLGTLAFDGDTIVADQRALYDDPSGLTRIDPDETGEYVVMGYDWCWETVDPDRCDQIVGAVPEPTTAS